MKVFKATTRLLSVLLLGIILTACGGATTDIEDVVPESNSIPSAQPDTAVTTSDQNVVIDALANDTGLEDGLLSITIFSNPSQGSVVINVSDNTITYTPNGLFVGSDEFTYKITDIDGDSSISNVSVEVACSTTGCSPSTKNLEWEPSQGVNIAGYNIHYGVDSENYTVTVWAGNTTQYDIILPDSRSYYFAVTAVDNRGAESDYSDEFLL